QEGLEMVINKRDFNFFTEGNSWLDGGLGSCSGGCSVDLSNNDQINVSSCVSCDLYLTSDLIYTHDTNGTSTIFSRKIFIDVGGGGSEAKVDAVVTWTNGNSPQSLTLTNYIYDSAN